MTLHANEQDNPEPEVTVQGVVDVGHCRVSYRKVGSGPNLLFVHGWPLNGATWRHVVPQLEGFTRIVVDLPGTPNSRATAQTPMTVRGHAAALVQVIDELGLDDVVLIGQDSGGMVCRFAAEARPEKVSALSMCGTEIPGVHAPLVKLFKVMAKLPGAGAMFKMCMKNRFLARTPLVFGGAVHDKSLLDGEFRTNVLEPSLVNRETFAGLLAMIREFSFDDIDALAAVHPKLTMPTLLVWGEDDPFFPVDKARAMAEQFGGPTEYRVIPQCKLLVHEEHPERFAKLTADFLAQHTNMLPISN